MMWLYMLVYLNTSDAETGGLGVRAISGFLWNSRPDWTTWDPKKKKRGYWGLERQLSSYEHLLLQKIQIWFPSPTWWPKTTHNSSFRASFALFWPLWSTRHTGGTHAYMQNTPAYRNLLFGTGFSGSLLCLWNSDVVGHQHHLGILYLKCLCALNEALGSIPKALKEIRPKIEWNGAR